MIGPGVAGFVNDNSDHFVYPRTDAAPSSGDFGYVNPGFRQIKKKDISDKEIDENVYEFVVPEVDPVTRNRVLGPGPKTQFDTPPTAFRQKSRKDAMGPDGVGEDVVKFVNKNSDVLQNPRDSEAPAGYNPYQSSAYGFHQKKDITDK